MLQIFSQNKKTLLLAIGIGLFLSFLPLHSANAQVNVLLDWFLGMTREFNITDLVGYVITLPLRIPVFILAISLTLFALGAGLLHSLIVAVSNWTTLISVNIGITPGNPLTPQIVTIGWNFTRDFANMFFIFALVFIGLSTILKIKDYEAKKALPALIIITLLINFTPVIVGFIVDMGNILTGFFLTKAGEIMNFSAIMDMVKNYLLDAMNDIVLTDGSFLSDWGTLFENLIGTLVYGVIIIIFFLAAAFVHFLVAAIFFLRIVMLWLLMILAPIAFLSRVLGQGNFSRKLFPGILHWDEWWQELIQWVIVGIPFGFFLYLSSWVMRNTVDIENMLDQAALGGELSGFAAQFITMLTSLLAPIVGLTILYIGYQISKKAAPALARGIIEGVEKAGKAAVMVAAVAVTAGAAGAIGGRMATAGAGLKASGMRGTEALAGKRGVKTWFRKRARGLQQRAGTGLEITGRKVEARKEEYETSRIEKAKKEIKGKTKERQFADFQTALTAMKLKRPGSRQKALGIAEGMQEDGNLSKAEDRKIFGPKEYQELVTEAKKRDRKTLYRHDPGKAAEAIEPEKWNQGEAKITSGERLISTGEDLRKKSEDATTHAEEVRFMAESRSPIIEGKKLVNEGKEAQKEIIEGILKETKPSQVSQISGKAFQNKTVKEAIVNNFTGNQMAEIGKNFGRDIVDSIQQGIEEMKFGELTQKNPGLTLWLQGNAAQNLGFKLPANAAGYTQERVRERVGVARAGAETAREDHKRLLETHYEGKGEAMMFRDYYRKDTPTKTKAMIKTILAEKGKTIPLEVEIKKKIGKLEKEFDRFSKEIWGIWKDFTKIEEKHKKAGSPTAGAIFEEWREAKRKYERVRRRVSDNQEDILKEEEKSLRKLL